MVGAGLDVIMLYTITKIESRLFMKFCLTYPFKYQKLPIQISEFCRRNDVPLAPLVNNSSENTIKNEICNYSNKKKIRNHFLRN